MKLLLLIFLTFKAVQYSEAGDPVEDVNHFVSTFNTLNTDVLDIYESMELIGDTAKIFTEKAGEISALILKSVKGQIGPDKSKEYLAMENLGKLVAKAVSRLAGAVQSLEAAVHYYAMMALYTDHISHPLGMLSKDFVYLSWNNASMSEEWFREDCQKFSPASVLHYIESFMVINCNFRDIEGEIEKENIIYGKSLQVFVTLESKIGLPTDLNELTNYNSYKIEIITTLCRMTKERADENINRLYYEINSSEILQSPYGMIKYLKSKIDQVELYNAFCFVTTVAENFGYRHQPTYAAVRIALKDMISASFAGVLCSSVLYENDPKRQAIFLESISQTMKNVTSFTQTLLRNKLNGTWESKIFESVVESTANKFDLDEKKQWNVTARKIRDELSDRGLESFVYQIIITEYSTSVEDVSTSFVLCQPDYCFVKSIGTKVNIYVTRVPVDSVIRVSDANIWLERNKRRIRKAIDGCYSETLPEIVKCITTKTNAPLIANDRHHTVILLKKKEYAFFDWIPIDVGFGTLNNFQGLAPWRNSTYYYPGWPLNRNYRIRIIWTI